MRVGFHNHKVEFAPVEGMVPYDLLLENTDPELVIFEMDLAWTTGGGADPLAYFRNYPGRFELLHVKDLTSDKKVATLGEGTIDFVSIFGQSQLAGMQYFFIEQDDCLTHTPMKASR
ncbi:MAG: hypothetical protein R2744_11125 [Bacteroidales bacterium]